MEAIYDDRNPNHPAGAGGTPDHVPGGAENPPPFPGHHRQLARFVDRVLSLPHRPGHRRRARREPPGRQGLPAWVAGPGLHTHDRGHPYAGRPPALRAPGGDRRYPGQPVRRHPVAPAGRPPAQGRADSEGSQGVAGHARHADRAGHPGQGHPGDLLQHRHTAGGNGPADHP